MFVFNDLKFLIPEIFLIIAMLGIFFYGSLISNYSYYKYMNVNKSMNKKKGDITSGTLITIILIIIGRFPRTGLAVLGMTGSLFCVLNLYSQVFPRDYYRDQHPNKHPKRSLKQECIEINKIWDWQKRNSVK